MHQNTKNRHIEKKDGRNKKEEKKEIQLEKEVKVRVEYTDGGAQK
jgi:hypothetical protein